MRIDAHNHPDWLGYDLERFLADMDANGIDKTWILSWECPEDERGLEFQGYTVVRRADAAPFPFERCLEYARAAPGRFVLGYAPDPRRARAAEHLAAAVDIYGVRVYGELKLRMSYDNPDALRVFRLCGERHLPVVLHIDYEIEKEQGSPRRSYWYGGGMEALERALGACPDTVFLGHAPGFWACISGDGRHLAEYYPGGRVQPGGSLVRLLRQYENLYCDLSGHSGCNALARDHGFAGAFLTEFQDRILYARDCFDNELQKLLDSLALPASVLEKIYGKNALRLVPPG